MTKTRKALLFAEAGGFLFVIICSNFMSKLNELCGGNLVGVMFGSVNKSIWESCKTLLLPYLVWGLIELLCVSPKMHRFTAAKTVSLWFLGLSYISLRLISVQGLLAELICVAASFALSFILYFSKINLEYFFPPSLFLLFLFWAVYFSFTPFPPENAVFIDPQTGLYGIIPPHIDKGAAVLDALYQF